MRRGDCVVEFKLHQHLLPRGLHKKWLAFQSASGLGEFTKKSLKTGGADILDCCGNSPSRLKNIGHTDSFEVGDPPLNLCFFEVLAAPMGKLEVEQSGSRQETLSESQHKRNI
jgi:hypothetical protein